MVLRLLESGTVDELIQEVRRLEREGKIVASPKGYRPRPNRNSHPNHEPTQHLESRTDKKDRRADGYSEAEVEEALIHQLDLICSESDMVWYGKPLNQVIQEAQQDRKNLLLAVHFLSESTRNLVTLAQERNIIMASAAIMVTRRLGVAKHLPELLTDQELQEGPGYIDSVGRIIQGASHKVEEDKRPKTGKWSQRFKKSQKKSKKFGCCARR